MNPIDFYINPNKDIISFSKKLNIHLKEEKMEDDLNPIDNTEKAIDTDGKDQSLEKNIDTQTSEKGPEETIDQEPTYDENTIDDDNDTNFGQPEEKIPVSNIGQFYILRKIYHRLLAIDDYLNFSNNPEFNKLEKVNTEAIEIFQIIIKNSEMYNDKLDEIIDLYHKYMEEILDKLKTALNNINA